MTEILLFFMTMGLLFLLFINLNITGGDFISPVSIVLIMCLLSLGISIFYINSVGFNVSIKASFLVMLAIISFVTPGLLMPLNQKKMIFIETGSTELYGKYVVLFAVLLSLVTTFFYYREVLKVAELSGFSNNSQLRLLYYYRTATLQDSEAVASRSKIVGQMTIASYAVSCLIMIDFLKRLYYKIVRRTKLISFGEFLCIATLFIQAVLSGGRTQFLYIVEGIAFVALFLYFRQSGGRSLNSKVYKKLLISVVLIYVLFYFLGNLTGKTSKLDMASTLFVYAGSPIPAFSELLDGKVAFANTSFGSDLLFGPIQILRLIGIRLNLNPAPAPAVSVGRLETNIYGSFGRIYGTTGVIGLVLINLFLGVLYQCWYKKLKKRVYKLELHLFCYMVISKFLFDFCVEERFFMSVISLGTILRIVYGFIFFFLFSIRFNRMKIIIKHNLSFYSLVRDV